MEHGPITILLEASRAGDQAARDELFTAVYQELRLVAHAQRRRWNGNETLCTTALIHESFLKLFAEHERAFDNRVHFYATASKAMRHVLVSYAEQQRAAKRGGDRIQVPLEEAEFVVTASAEEVIGLDELLNRLEDESPRRCRVVECRVFGGMSIEETAHALDVSTATVKRDWRVASLLLYRELTGVDKLEPANAAGVRADRV